MDINERKDDDVTILEFSGKITIGRGDVALREAVHDALGRGRQKLVLDMSGVKGIDSAGIGELIAAFTSVKNRGGELKVAALSPKVASILGAIQLTGVLEPQDTVETAIADLRGFD